MTVPRGTRGGQIVSAQSASPCAALMPGQVLRRRA